MRIANEKKKGKALKEKAKREKKKLSRTFLRAEAEEDESWQSSLIDFTPSNRNR